MKELEWSVAQYLLPRDGAFWEAYVHFTNLDDWDKVIASIKSTYSYIFTISGEAAKLRSATDIFALDSQLLPFLSVKGGAVEFNTYFQREDEIVFDIRPRDVTGPGSLSDLVTFVRQVADSAGKVVRLSPEGLHHYAFLEYNPTKKEFEVRRTPIRDGFSELG
jgi:hypothetical protein